ncbi:MAG: GNAT family N-acetyltransferase [Rhodocyclaceae bacterium]|nr:GNAT family N-acetyltransferase [Rhodocyclaceae bacterium]MDZ4213811.1 GNAT family N-acetyltransferase [Rhodocyclaceae bacterium]
MTLHIELLGGRHRRAGFNCGEPALDAFLTNLAGQQQRKNFGRTYVALADDSLTIAGFVTVSAGQVATACMPAGLKLPRYPVPVMRVGRLAVDGRHRGRGIGKALLRFALGLAQEWSAHVGIYGVAVEAKHAIARDFYLRLGFLAGRDDPLHMILPLATLKLANPGHDSSP